jgi:hypothetical protein
VRPSQSSLRAGKRKVQGNVAPNGGGGRNEKRVAPEGDIAPVIGRWAEACFPVGSQTSEAALRDVLKEAADSARDYYGPEDAVAWAEGYTFPPDFVTNDMRCLEAAQGDFEAMVRQRLAELTPGRLNADRVSRLHPDNPEVALLSELVEGMRFHLPEGFTTNGMMPRTDRRPIYETVATAVNKMLGAVIEQKLAFLLPL